MLSLRAINGSSNSTRQLIVYPTLPVNSRVDPNLRAASRVDSKADSNLWVASKVASRVWVAQLLLCSWAANQ